MTQPDPKLTKWIRKQLTLDLTEEGEISRFELYHAADGGIGGDILARADVLESADADDLSVEIHEAALNDAETRTSGVPQRYTVVAYTGLSNKIAGQHAFLLEGGGERVRMLNMADTFSPTDVGERAMNMSQTAEMHRLMFKQSAYFSDAARQDAERERRLRLKYEEQRLQMYEMIEQLQDKAHERELARAREDARARRTEQILQMLLGLAPVLVAKLGVVGGVGQSIARDEGALQIFKSFSEAELMGILEACEPANRIKLMELYESYRDQQGEREKGVHPLLRDQPEETEIH